MKFFSKKLIIFLIILLSVEVANSADLKGDLSTTFARVYPNVSSKIPAITSYETWISDGINTHVDDMGHTLLDYAIVFNMPDEAIQLIRNGAKGNISPVSARETKEYLSRIKNEAKRKEVARYLGLSKKEIDNLSDAKPTIDERKQKSNADYQAAPDLPNSVYNAIRYYQNANDAEKKQYLKKVLDFINFNPNNINAVDSGKNILYWAVLDNAYEIAELLIMRGANLKFRSYPSGTSIFDEALFIPIHFHASSVSYSTDNIINMLKLLINNNADVNMQGIGGNTILTRAVNLDLADIVRFLINEGKADIFAQNADGTTVLDKINESHISPEIRKMILEKKKELEKSK